MRLKFLSVFMAAITIASGVTAQQLDLLKVKEIEQRLEDVMEIIDTGLLKLKLEKVEQAYASEPTEFNRVRLGIIYHETALNFSFLSKTQYKGYAKKSFDTLSVLFNSIHTTRELMPFIASYRASALSLVGAETRKLRLLNQAFVLFDDAVNNYSAVSYLPEFLRGSVAENLPWFFFSKRKFAKTDFESIISKQANNAIYANWKTMSFTYFAWANQHQSMKYRPTAIDYLDRAIALDVNYNAGRKKAEALKLNLLR